MYEDFKATFTDMQRLNAMSHRNSRKYNQKVRYYTIYQIFELVICLGVCFTQVTFIKKLLKGSSIV